MVPIPESARHVLTSGLLGHLVTIDPDGGPQVTCAWIGIENGEIVIATLPDQRKLRNIRRDPRVALSVETSNLNPYGLTEYLVVHGRARVTEGGAPELLQELAYTYIGPGVKFPPMPDPPPGFVTRITPERFGGIGPWAEG
jgi:PPOX class probable F420-dependent enzyme